MKMFAPKQLYPEGKQLLLVAEMLFLNLEIPYSIRKHLLTGDNQLSLCAVHRLSKRGIFHS